MRQKILKPTNLLEVGLLLVVYIALWLAILHSIDLNHYIVLSGGLVLLLLPLRENKRLFYLCFGLLLAVGLLLLFVHGDLVANGLRLLANRLFTVSEARQTYLYDHFPVDAASYAASLRAALLTLGFSSVFLLCIGRLYARRVVVPLLFVAFSVAAAYFGITPSAGYTVAFLLSLGALLLLDAAARRGSFAAIWQTLLLCLVPVCLIIGVTALAFPGESRTVSAWDEQLRDTLAGSTLFYRDTATQAPTQEATLPTEPPEPPTLPDAQDTIFAAHSNTLLVVLVCLLALLLLFLPSVFYDRYKRCVAKNRTGMDSEDNAAAIRACFAYALRWLTAYGLADENQPYAALAPRLKALLSPNYAEEFLRILPLWQEAAYSAHAMPPEARELVQAFAEQTAQAVLEKLGRRKGFLLRLRNGL